jgi:hypothetical protein
MGSIILLYHAYDVVVCVNIFTVHGTPHLGLVPMHIPRMLI